MAAPQITRSPESDKDSFGYYKPAILRRLKISPEVGYYLASRDIPLPTCVPLIKTPEPRWVKGAAFDGERVDKVIRAFRALKHTQGRLAGKPLNPDPWQVAYIIAPIFGWVAKNDYGEWVRIIRNATVDVPRKNGKSTLAGGFALYMTAADGEPGAQVVAAASTKDQAGFVFKPVKALAEKSPALKGHMKALGTSITHRRSESVFTVVSSKADAQHGANIHGAVIDELHVHKTPDLVEAIETGTGSREQPLILKITTADSGKPHTVYATNRRYIEQLAAGVFKDPARYGVVFAAPDNVKDLFSEATQRLANPGFGISPTRESLRDAAKQAQNSPEDLAKYKRLHLGMRTKQATAYIDLNEWKRNAGKPIDEDDLAGMECYGGLDLASVSDITAFCLIFPHYDGEGYEAVWRFWTPEDNVQKLDERTAKTASVWVREGWLRTTPGNVTDYDYIRDQILADCDKFDVLSIGIDRWNSTQLTNQLLAEDVPVVKIGQGFVSMNDPMKEMQRLVKKGKRGQEYLHHGGNPVMTWMVDNLAVATDPAGNVKPDKANSGDKIDGVSALANALSEALNPGERVPAPDTGHRLIIA